VVCGLKLAIQLQLNASLARILPQLILQKAHAKLQILALTNNCLANQSKMLALTVMIAMLLESFIQGCVFMDNTLEHQMEHVLLARSTLIVQRMLRRQLN
jgi:hypothetical protein